MILPLYAFCIIYTTKLNEFRAHSDRIKDSKNNTAWREVCMKPYIANTLKLE